jgi:Transcription initiation factor IIF, auxiliary subunit
MDKLADGLQKLNEDDLLQVVQMVHDNKAADSYTKNDVERKFLSILGISQRKGNHGLLDVYSEQNANLALSFL